MFQDDYILRQIDMLSRFLGKVVFDKDLEFVSLLDEEGGNIGDDLFAYRLRKLLSERKINEGENLLFETVEAEPSEQNLKTALEFYEELKKMSDKELEACDFSYQEILEGLRALQKFYVHMEEPEL